MWPSSRLQDMPSSPKLQPSEDIDSHFYRLSKHFVPVRYELEFQPDKENSRFRGKEIIQIEARGAGTLKIGRKESSPCAASSRLDSSANFSEELCQRCLVLHGIELSIRQEEVFISVADDKILRCIGIVARPYTSETLALYFDRALPQEAGQRFELHIDFYEGRINSTQMTKGLFHSSSSDPGFLATQLEPTHARKVFPCFDEPSFRAVFQLSVVVDPTYMVVSNTPLVREEEEVQPWTALSHPEGSSRSLEVPPRVEKPHSNGGSGEKADYARNASPFSTLTNLQTGAYYHRFVFEETPPIHTCIVGFNVGKFSIIERRCSRRNILYRVVFPRGHPASTAVFVLNLLNAAVDFFSSFFNLCLGLKKMDLVALECYQSMGMENWGMINIRLDYFFVSNATPLEQRRRTARLVGHEVCHHWIGNYLSIEWWTDIWLKEGMCRLLEFYFVDRFYPGWCIWDEFVGNVCSTALAADVVAANTHPLRSCDMHPRSIPKFFDVISYGKGAMLLRLLLSLVGLPALQKAVMLLLRRYGNTSINFEKFKVSLLEVHGDTADVRFCTIVERVLDLTGCAGHPYVLICRRGPGVYCVSQYAMPCLAQGVLLDWVRQQRQSGVRVDLFTLPTDTTFEWDPIQLMRRQTDREDFVFPILVLESAGDVSVTHELFLDCDDVEYKVHGGTDCAGATSPLKASDDSVLCYFNYGATSPLRCDYDLSTWRQIFSSAVYLRSEDCIAITGTLSALRNVLVGRFPYETEGDRCTLVLEWLSTLTTSSKLINSSVWLHITSFLEELLYLVQGHDCSQVVHDFVEGLYTPLLQHHAISFFVTEDSLNFEEPHHISCATVNNVLRVLTLCGASSLRKEATEMGTHALHEVGRRWLDQLNPFPAPVVGSDRRVDFTNSTHIDSAATALLYLVLHRPDWWWCRIAGIVSSFFGIDTQSLEQNMHLSIPKILFKKTENIEMFTVLMPAFFSMGDDRAFDFMSNALSKFSILTDTILRTLLWNTRFLVHFLRNYSPTLSPLIAEELICSSAKICSNSYVVSLLYANLASPKASTAELALFQELLPNEQAETATTTCGHEAGSHLAQNVLESFSAMKVNCVWIAYCGTHIGRFLCRRPEQRV